MQTFAWQGFEFEHPDDWECVRFSKNRTRGECAFSSRTGPRMSLLWSAIAGSADIRRFASEASSQLKKSDPKGRVTAAEWKGPGTWTRLSMGAAANCLAVALAHLPNSKDSRGLPGLPDLMVQAQFYPDEVLNAAVQRRVLESFRLQNAQPASSARPTWRWNAFGCRVQLPREFELSACEVFPGRAAMTFKTPGRRGQRLKIERLALPEQQLKGKSVAHWRLSTLEDVSRVIKTCERQLHRPRWARRMELKAVAAARRLQWLTRVPRQARTAAWVCDREQRLYCAEWEGVAGTAPDLEAILECC